MKEVTNKLKRKQRRLARTRNKVRVLKDRVRLTVFRSNQHIYAQIIDDKQNKTLVSVSEKELEGKGMNKTQKAEVIGQTIAKKAIEKKVKTVVFDKGSYRYHGRVKALAEGARKEGLVF
jgi:large subunit ribosomal protein L18